MNNQFKITIEKLTPEGKVVASVDASMNQDIILHLAKNHNIDGIDEIYKIAKGQFYEKLNPERQPVIEPQMPVE
jgi:hydrogenase maturation factor